MKKIITYGTFDLFHQGHYNLLKRAKEKGDYLIVGVTSEQYDKARGKLNVRDSLMKRIDNVKNTGFADEVIIEEYIGQKIDDIQKYQVDEFVIGSDWMGKFDYLNEYCKVTYLERTKGISSTDIRNDDHHIIKIGVIGSGRIARRFVNESKYVSGIHINSVFNPHMKSALKFKEENELKQAYDNLDCFLDDVDAIYIATPHQFHFKYAVKCLQKQKHVLCEKPITLKYEETRYLYELADKQNLVLMEGIKTAYCPAFQHLIHQAKSGAIGKIKCVDATFTKLIDNKTLREYDRAFGGSVNELISYPMLAITKLLGSDFKSIAYYSSFDNEIDTFTKTVIQYNHAVATAQVGIGYKSEGNLIITGSKGYILVPSPWWLTQEFHVCFEDIHRNAKFFYKYEGDGLRYEISEFIERITDGKKNASLTSEESIYISKVIDGFNAREGIIEI